MALSEAAIGAIVQGGTALAGAGASAIAAGNLNRKNRQFQQEEAEKQRLWNESMAEKQNAWNNEMWLKATEYDNPANQVQRLRDAGLNPLFYGLDGNASQVPQAAAQPLGYERADAGNWSNPVAAGVDAAVKIAQVSNIQADTAKKNNENLTETQRREKLLADIEEVRQNVKLKMAQEGLTDAEKRKLEKDMEWLDLLNEASLNEKKSAAALNDSQKKRIDDLLEGEKLIQSKTIEDFDKKWQKIRAEISKMSKETGLLDKDIEYYALNHANNGFMGTGFSVLNLIRALRGGNRDSKERDIPDDIEDLIQSGQ